MMKTGVRLLSLALAAPCREYTMDVVIGGRSEKACGTACRQPDGSWRAQN